MTTHPMQEVIIADDGLARFKKNAIVAYLLDAGRFTMNDLAKMPGASGIYGGAFPREDWEQFAQLIGYSVRGFGELSYASDEMYDRALQAGQKLRDER